MDPRHPCWHKTTGSTLGYPSASEADLAFCAYLAFWTQDIEQIDRLYRRSGLMREKWGREDYRERTIQLAIDTTPCVFAPPISLQGNQSERTWGAALIEQA
jgi:hypothetical protein